MAAIIPLLMVFTAAAGLIAWLLRGLPGLLTLTYGIADFCQSFLVRCVEYYSFTKLALLWLGALLLAAGIVYGVLKGLVNLFRAYRAATRLPLSDKGSVVLISDDTVKAAFTHGLLRPRIYISTGLIKSLTRTELKAVFLHELHHKRRFDPLRFFLLSLLRDSFFYIPAVRDLVNMAHAKKEDAADDASAVSMKEPLSLAKALLKVAAFNREFSVIPVSIAGRRYSGSIEGRVRRLVEGKTPELRLPSLKAITASLFTATLLTLSLSMPLFAAHPVSMSGHPSGSALHIDGSGADCKTHCVINKHKH